MENQALSKRIVRVGIGLLAAITLSLAAIGITTTPAMAVTGNTPTFDDGRVNQNGGMPVAVYCTPDGSVEFWEIVDGKGELLDYLTLTPKNIAHVANGGYLMRLWNDIVIYGWQGQFELQAPQSDGKIYHFQWSGCSPIAEWAAWD